MLQKALTLEPADTRGDHEASSTVFGFWLYLMTDCIIFAALFAVFAVMAHQFAGGPSAKDLFDIPGVAVETGVLLLSSIAYGFAMLGAHRGRVDTLLFWLGITFHLCSDDVFMCRKNTRCTTIWTSARHAKASTDVLCGSMRVIIRPKATAVSTTERMKPTM